MNTFTRTAEDIAAEIAPELGRKLQSAGRGGVSLTAWRGWVEDATFCAYSSYGLNILSHLLLTRLDARVWETTAGRRVGVK
jgi:hypothetical protein